ncbi:ELWxxDGT repeat protein [Hyalangium sp.]|uniref:ELWxxDGT repeat protein n=1 Tax=Hyalangium sp. TaxID=2028555 RepID=UPI002D503C65|nr:ELWxxDGT repeat protein [Hyalangium sp.]HYI03180.1 ELWxxDGT repeat protein [Hyalangium sp.]
MRCWRPFFVVLALLSGITVHSQEPLPEEEAGGASSLQDARGWKPCGRRAALLDPSTGAVGLGPSELVHGDQVLLFTEEDGENGLDLWKSSGTQGEGISLVKDFSPELTGISPMELTRVGTRVFFAAEDAEHGRELWVSDGTTGGTQGVKDLWPGPIGSFPRSLFSFGGLLYFSAGDEEHGHELWRSDGTPMGTFQVEDLEPGPEGTHPQGFVRGSGGALYFLIDRGGFFRALMRSDGGPGAVELFRVPSTNLLESLTPVGQRLFFITGDSHELMAELMVTEGGAPVRVGMFSELHELVAMGGRLYFSASTHEDPANQELWRSDGTPEGTRRVKDLRPGSEGSHPQGLTVVGRRLFFTADDGMHGRELWVSDGTASGTRLFTDLEPGALGSSPEELTAIQDHVFFSADTAGRGRSPWVSDGTPRGTVAIEGPVASMRASNPREFVRSGWDVFFSAEVGSSGRRLWALPFRPAGRCDR